MMNSVKKFIKTLIKGLFGAVLGLGLAKVMDVLESLYLKHCK